MLNSFSSETTDKYSYLFVMISISFGQNRPLESVFLSDLHLMVTNNRTKNDIK